MKRYILYIIVLILIVGFGAFFVYKYNNVVIDVDLTPEQRSEYEAKLEEWSQKLGQADPEDSLGRPNMDAFLEKARYEYYLGRLSDAIRTLEEGLDYYPGTSAMLHNMAKAYEAMGRYSRAIALYKELINGNGNTAYFIDIARAARLKGDLNLAKESYWEYQKIYKSPDQEFEEWFIKNEPNP